MQTGNVIFLGLGIAGAAGAPVVAPLIALVASVAGGGLAALLAETPPATAGARPRRRAGDRGLAPGRGRRNRGGVDVEPGQLSAYATIALLALAMGVRNTMVRGFGGPNPATTVLNLTLTALTSPAPLSVASGSDLAQRAAAFLAILAGAASGALLLKTSLALPSPPPPRSPSPPASATCGRSRPPPEPRRTASIFRAAGPET
jgi:Protein of unknown function (DUF1275)